MGFKFKIVIDYKDWGRMEGFLKIIFEIGRQYLHPAARFTWQTTAARVPSAVYSRRH